jgi:predicted exporter
VTLAPRPLLVWPIWIAFAAACLWLVLRTPLVTDITAFLPGPASSAQKQLAEQLRDGVAARVALIGIEAKDDTTAAALSKALAQRLSADANFRWVANGQPAQIAAERDAVFAARYLLSPRVDAQRFSEAGLREAAAELEALLRSSAAPLVKPFAARDPTAEMIATFTQLAGAPAPATRHDVWFDAQQRTAILIATTRAPGFDVDAQARAKLAIESAFSAAQREAGYAAAHLTLTGPGMFAVDSRAAIQSDAERLAIVATVAISALLYFAIRSLRLLFAAALPVGLGTLAGLAAVAAATGTIHGITLGFGMTLIGEAVDYAIYVQVQRRGAAADTRLWRALWLAVLTSGAGFVAMMLSGFQGLVQLGLMSIVGLAAAALAARTLLPDVLRPLSDTDRARLHWARHLRALRDWLRWLVFGSAVAATVFLLLRGPSLWNDALAAISPLAPAAGERDAQIRSALGMPDLRYVIAVEGKDLDNALAHTEALHPVLADLAARKSIAGFSSPAHLLPSRATQEERRATLPDADALRARVAAAFQGTALRAAAFEPFIRDVQVARAAPLLTPEHFAGTGLGERLAGQLRIGNVGGSGATVYVTVNGVADGAALAATLRGKTQVVLLDLKSDVETLIAEYRGKAAWAALGGAVAIVLLLALQLRDARATWRIALALACAVLITAALVTLLEGALTLFHLVALLLVVGIGSNYALFFGLPRAERDDIAVPASVLLCMASTLIAFALLAASRTPVLHMIGLTAAIGAAVSMIAAVAVAQPANERP